MVQNYRACRNDWGVSPVVGVMLMLVATIIIAAVVSGFTGGLVNSNNQKAPTLLMDVKIINMGSWTGSGFFATVTGVSEPIPTSNLKIVTSWTTTNKITGATITGGNTTLPGNPNINVLGDPTVPLSGFYAAPFGTGPGINGTTTVGGFDTNLTSFSGPRQQFGNYSLMTGTTMVAMPCGGASGSIGGTFSGGTEPSAAAGYGIGGLFAYTNLIGSPYLDPISAILGPYWENLRTGDIVTVKVIHIPTGKVIFQKDVKVTEG